MVPLTSLLAAAIAAVATPSVLRHLVQMLDAGPDEPHFVAASPGSVIAFAVIFAVLWFVMNLLLVVPWFLLKKRCRSS